MSDADISPSNAPVTEVVEPPILFITRFSFLGVSGWKSDISKDKELLFDPDRLRRRIRLFQQITLPTLLAQTDQNFHHLVLSSSEMPDAAKQELKSVCKTALGDRCTVDFKPVGPARKFLRHFMVHKFQKNAVAQVVLDDDDGLACDFVETIRQDIRVLMSESELPVFASYSGGYGLVNQGEGVKLFAHNYPFINLGLTMVAGASDRNILAISHKAAPQKSHHIRRRAPRMFIRSVHEDNDSRVEVTDRWVPQPDWQSDAEITDRFPYLTAIETQ